MLTKMRNLIIDWFFNSILNFFVGILGLSGFSIIGFTTFAENFFIRNYPKLTMFLLAIGFVCFLILLCTVMKIYKDSKLKIVNQIAVDRTGVCFCPSCHKILTLKITSSLYDDKSFFCFSCKEKFSPISKDGNLMCAGKFYNFQKRNPQIPCVE